MESLQLVARKFLSSEESSFQSLDTFVELFDPVVTYGAPPPLSFLELVRSIVSYYHGTLLVHSNLLDAATACFEPGGNAGESPTRITDDTLIRVLLELWIVAAVQCEIKTEYSEMIVSLPDEHQDALMGIIQDILDTVTPYEESQAVKSFPPATSHTMMASPPAPQSHTVPLSAASRDVIMELQATREELEDLRAQNAALQGRFRDAGPSPSSANTAREAASSSSTIKYLEAQLNELRAILSEKDAALSGTKAQLEDDRRSLEERLKIQSDELDILRSKAGDVKRLELQITKLKAKVAEGSEVASRVLSLEESCAAASKRVSDLEADNAALNSTHQQLRESREELRALEAKWNDVSGTLTMKDRKVAQLVSENKELHGKVAALETEVHEVSATLHATQEELRDKDGDVQEWKSKAHRASTEIESVRSERDALRAAALAATAASTAASTSQVESANHELEFKIIEKDTQLAVKASRILELEDEATGLTSKLSHAEAALDARKVELGEERARLHAVSEELRVKKDLEGEHAEELATQLEVLQSQRDAADKSYQELTARNAVVTKEADALREETARAKARAAHAEEALRTSESERVKADKTLHTLQARLHNATESHSREELLVTTALFEFGRDMQRHLLRGSLYASSAYATAAPAERWLSSGSTTAVLAGGKSWLAHQRELAIGRLAPA